jgi:dihydroorotate dehydrogenase
MSVLWERMKPLLFRSDAEEAHHRMVRMLRKTGALPGGRTFLRFIAGVDEEFRPAPAVERFGMRFRSPVGLAAGFDKNAELLPLLPDLGFGFVEIGTVTPRAQPGNPKPRLFRDPETRSLFNCLGFNGDGALTVADRVREARAALPKDFRVGLNIGKNKDTPLERAHEDYLEAVKPFRNLIDFTVVNVSSPNTPGLRALQDEKSLSAIVSPLLQELSHWDTHVPLLVKLAPELFSDGVPPWIGVLEALGVSGWVLSNTLSGTFSLPKGSLSGGWSGGKVREAAHHALLELRKRTTLPIVSVGGILDSEEARRRRAAGADLIEVYSGWVFGGPRFPRMIAAVWEEKLAKKA